MRKGTWGLALGGVIAAALFAMVNAAPALADQPQAVGWEAVQGKTPRKGIYKRGAGARPDHNLAVRLFPSHREIMKSNLLIVFPGCGEDPEVAGRPVLNLASIIANGRQGEVESPDYVPDWTRPGPRWRVCPSRDALLMKQGRPATVGLKVDFLRDSDTRLSPRLYGQVYVVPPAMLKKAPNARDLAALYGKKAPDSTFVIDLYYRLSPVQRRWYLGNYAKVFGVGVSEQKLPGDGAETGDYLDMAKILPVVVSPYRRTMPQPDIPDDAGAALFRETLAAILSQGNGQVGDQDCIRDDDYVRRQAVTAPVIQVGPGTYSLSGIFSTRWSSDHALHPGWGFRAEAWTNENGPWERIGWDWVQSNGTWSITVPADAGYEGGHLRMLYRSYNSYYRPQDQDNNTYSWKDPDHYDIPFTFSAGHRYADTDGGDYNGVGELVDAAMYNWSRLYWIGGIDPVHPSAVGPINFFFPNTWYDCGDGSGVPWSCSSKSDPNIWLIAGHGIAARVVVHELGHQLNNKYWDWKRPANSGGSHSLNSCYSAKLGMTLREGFANFMPGWVGYPDRNVADGGFGSGRWSLSYDLEQNVAPPNCANGWENEVWVARTFWDLHDTRTDGDDILWFTHRGAVPAIYLANGISSDGDAADMRDYEATYRGYASSGHEGFITDIFEQNRH